MASLRIAAFLHVLSFAFFIQFGMGLDPLHYDCFNAETFNTTTRYASYLKKVLHVLRDNTSLTGFATASAGNPKRERAYGLALCRGDVSTQDCKACVIQARNWTTTSCPSNKGAIIWFDNCFLKYTNTPFFGKVDIQNRFGLYNQNDMRDPDFITKAADLFLNITEQAYVSAKLYAAGETDTISDGTGRLYGLAQCTRDLTVDNCKVCIASAMNQLLGMGCCTWKNGARVMTGSCAVRYELYPFFNS